MSGPIIVRCLQRDDDVAVVGKGKALLRNSWPRNVPAQALKLLALIRLAGDTSMQREASVLVLSTVSSLMEKGVSKTKIGVIDECVSKLNLAVSLDSEGSAKDVAFLLEKIGTNFYRKNGIKPNQKYLALVENLNGLPFDDNTVISQLL
jgi:hypothetical protein